MKEYAFTLEIDKDIRSQVYRLTANAAMERGDAVHVATEDNEDIIERFVVAALPVLRGAFGRYEAKVFLSGDVEVIVNMPDNWNGSVDELRDLCRDFLVNMAVAGWFGLSGSGENFVSAANVALSGIGLLMEKRLKPVR